MSGFRRVERLICLPLMSCPFVSSRCQNSPCSEHSATSNSGHGLCGFTIAIFARRHRIATPKRTLQGVVAKFVTDLRFHERVLARFLVTERALEKALDALGGEGVDELSSLLREPAIRDQVTKAVRDGVEALLRRPLKDIVGAPDAARVSALSESLSKGALSLLRADSTQMFVANRIESAFSRSACCTLKK